MIKYNQNEKINREVVTEPDKDEKLEVRLNDMSQKDVQ